MDAIIKLRKKIANESIQERDQLQQTHRYYSTTHKMRSVEPILNGKYLQTGNHANPPAELAAAMGMPIPPALLTTQAQKQEVERG
jgi:NAD(P)H-quinone oxidoreductase subunit K